MHILRICSRYGNSAMHSSRGDIGLAHALGKKKLVSGYSNPHKNVTVLLLAIPHAII